MIRKHTRSIVAACVTAALIALLVVGVRSYQAHAAIRQAALHQLVSTADKRNTTSKHPLTSRSGPTTPGVSGTPPALTPAELGISLPIGTVNAVTPDLPSSVTGSATTPMTTSAASSPAGPPSAPAGSSMVTIALLTPLIETSQFGASVGFLLGCNSGVGTLTAVATQVPGLTNVLDPVLAQVGPECSKLSAQAVSSLNTLNSDLAALEGLTPGTKPYFAALDTVFAELNTVAPEVEPLTGTLTALGPLVDFFSAQPQAS
jgi:hypothetical protein